MTRAIVTYDGVSRTIVVEPNRRVSFVDIVESGVDATSENGPGAPVALDWAWLEAGFDVLHQLGELDSGDSLQPRIDTLLDGVRRIAEAPDGEWAHVHVPGLVTMLAAHPTVRSRLAVSDHPELRRVDLAVAWALGSHPEREWVMLRDPVLASRLRRLDQRGASTDEYLASVAAYRSRRPPPLRSWLWDGERMAVWKSLPRSVKRQVGDNFGVSVDDLAACGSMELITIEMRSASEMARSPLLSASRTSSAASWASMSELPRNSRRSRPVWSGSLANL